MLQILGLISHCKDMDLYFSFESSRKLFGHSSRDKN